MALLNTTSKSKGFLFPVLFLLLWGAQVTAHAATEKNTLRVATSREIESLDPLFVDGMEAGLVAGSLFEGLTALDPQTARPQPGVAESWKVSEDGLTYTFQLRQDAQWSDGRTVTSQHFIDAWQRALHPASGAYYAYLFDPIEGAEDYRKGKLDAFTKVHVRASGPKEIEVKLREPTGYFLELVSNPTYFPVRKDLIAAHPEDWLKPDRFVGNGPFILESWTHKQKIQLIRSPTYRGAHKVELDEALLFPIESFKTALNMYESGDLDWITRVPPHLVQKLQNRTDFRRGPSFSTVYLRFNTTSPNFADRRLRRAISLAIDRKILAEKVAREGQIAATRFVPAGLYGDLAQEQLVSMDVDEAKKLLNAVIQEKGEIPPTELLFIADEQSSKIALAIAVMLKKNLGLVVAPKNLERGVFYSHLDRFNYDLARSSYTARFFDPMSFLEKFTSDNITNNLTGFANKTYDALIAQARKIPQEEKRAVLLRQAEAILVQEEAAIVPLYHNTSVNMWKENLVGLHTNPLGVHPLRNISFRK